MDGRGPAAARTSEVLVPSGRAKTTDQEANLSCGIVGTVQEPSTNRCLICLVGRSSRRSCAFPQEMSCKQPKSPSKLSGRTAQACSFCTGRAGVKVSCKGRRYCSRSGANKGHCSTRCKMLSSQPQKGQEGQSACPMWWSSFSVKKRPVRATLSSCDVRNIACVLPSRVHPR